MSKNVELVKVSESYWKIMRGRAKSFGFVKRCPNGWVAVYRFNGEKLRAVEDDPEKAFRTVIRMRNDRFAKAVGFSSTSELDQHNRQVRARNRQRKAGLHSALINRDFDRVINLLLDENSK